MSHAAGLVCRHCNHVLSCFNCVYCVRISTEHKCSHCKLNVTDAPAKVDPLKGIPGKETSFVFVALPLNLSLP